MAVFEFWDSRYHAAAGPMPIWEACAATRGHGGISRPKPLLKTMLGPWSCCSWNSPTVVGVVFLSVTHVPTESFAN